MKARGANGQIELEGKRLVIRRKGLLAAMSQEGAAEITVPVSQIEGVEFQPASLFRSGFLRLVVKGENEQGSNLWQATRDPYAVMFKIGRQQRSFVKLSEALEKSLRKQARRG